MALLVAAPASLVLCGLLALRPAPAFSWARSGALGVRSAALAAGRDAGGPLQRGADREHRRPLAWPWHLPALAWALGLRPAPGREICGTGSSSASSKGVSGGFPWQAVPVRTGTLLVKIVRAAPWLQVLGAPWAWGSAFLCARFGHISFGGLGPLHRMKVLCFQWLRPFNKNKGRTVRNTSLSQIPRSGTGSLDGTEQERPAALCGAPGGPLLRSCLWVGSWSFGSLRRSPGPAPRPWAGVLLFTLPSGSNVARMSGLSAFLLFPLLRPLVLSLP